MAEMMKKREIYDAWQICWDEGRAEFDGYSLTFDDERVVVEKDGEEKSFGYFPDLVAWLDEEGCFADETDAPLYVQNWAYDNAAKLECSAPGFHCYAIADMAAGTIELYETMDDYHPGEDEYIIYQGEENGVTYYQDELRHDLYEDNLEPGDECLLTDRQAFDTPEDFEAWQDGTSWNDYVYVHTPDGWLEAHDAEADPDWWADGPVEMDVCYTADRSTVLQYAAGFDSMREVMQDIVDGWEDAYRSWLTDEEDEDDE